MCLTCAFGLMSKEKKEKLFQYSRHKTFLHTHDNQTIKLNDAQIDEIIEHALHVVATGEVHCVSNKTRSDLDLFLLCRHYFTMSYNEFEKQFKLLKNAKNKLPGHNNHSYNILGSGYCHTIGRRVYYHIQNVQDKNAIIEQFSGIKLKINKTSNIGETL